MTRIIDGQTKTEGEFVVAGGKREGAGGLLFLVPHFLVWPDYLGEVQKLGLVCVVELCGWERRGGLQVRIEVREEWKGRGSTLWTSTMGFGFDRSLPGFLA